MGGHQTGLSGPDDDGLDAHPRGAGSSGETAATIALTHGPGTHQSENFAT